MSGLDNPAEIIDAAYKDWLSDDDIKPLSDSVLRALKHNGYPFVTWRSEKPDLVGWWLYVFPSPEGPCCESSYWDENYLAEERRVPRYNDRTALWAKIELPSLDRL